MQWNNVIIIMAVDMTCSKHESGATELPSGQIKLFELNWVKLNWVECAHFVDIDECREMTEICGSHAICNNQPGTFRCECMDSFQFASDGKTCVGM